METIRSQACPVISSRKWPRYDCWVFEMNQLGIPVHDSRQTGSLFLLTNWGPGSPKPALAYDMHVIHKATEESLDPKLRSPDVQAA